MSDTASPNGLVPSRRWGSASNSTGTNMYNIASGYATSMYTGTLVEVSAGNLTILANGANSGAAPKPIRWFVLMGRCVKRRSFSLQATAIHHFNSS